MPSEQELHQKFISLVGKKISIGLRSSGEKIDGTVTNAMFDSFRIESPAGTDIVRFNELLFVKELD